MSKQSEHREWFIKHRPWICHVSLAHDVSSIHKHGLLSTSALLDLFGITGEERHEHELTPRKLAVPLTHPLHGRALLNDQSPLHLGGLERCLDGMTSAEWCQELNSRVFFRPLKERWDCSWNTKLTNDCKRIALVAATRAFLDVYESELYATSINPGFTKREPVRRGRRTFKPLAELFEQKQFSVSAVSEISMLHKMSRTDLFTQVNNEAIEA